MLRVSTSPRVPLGLARRALSTSTAVRFAGKTPGTSAGWAQTSGRAASRNPTVTAAQPIVVTTAPGTHLSPEEADLLKNFRPRTAKAGQTTLRTKEEEAAAAAAAAAAVAPTTAGAATAATASTTNVDADRTPKKVRLGGAARSGEQFFASGTSAAPSSVTKPKTNPAASSATPPPTPPTPPTPPSSPLNQSANSDSTPPPHPPRSLLRRAFKWGTVFAVGSGVLLLVITNGEELRAYSRLTPSEMLQSLSIFANSVVRMWRDLYCVVYVVVDYEWSLRNLTGDELERKKKEVHLRSALRIRDVINANGGTYIKFGQHVAQMQFLLPDEYVDTMKPMLNQAPTSSFEEVERVFFEETGKKLMDVFETFERTPIASASLAQVHFATLPSVNGEPPRRVAVKIQHRQLAQNCEADIATVRFLIRLVNAVDSRFNYEWLGNEMAENLPLECDFVHEAKNSERARANLRCDTRTDVYIPRVYWDWTSKRVLVMERMEGCLINDVHSLRAQGISLDAISTLMSQVFSEQIFIHGFVHCDPHAGNMFVTRRSPTDARPRLILLDHGLYRELNDQFRMAYAHLWDALIRGDAEGIKKYSQEMNAGDMYPLFASILTRKTLSQITGSKGDPNALVSKNDESERAAMQAFAVKYAQDVHVILARVPKQLLLLLKTNDCLRSIDTQLGTPINSFVIMARYCTKAINRQRLLTSTGTLDWIKAAYATFSMEARIVLMRFLLQLAAAWQRTQRMLHLPA